MKNFVILDYGRLNTDELTHILQRLITSETMLLRQHISMVRLFSVILNQHDESPLAEYIDSLLSLISC